MSSARPGPDGPVVGKVLYVRFVWAVVAFVVAALMIGAGIAQRTIFEAPVAESVAVETDSDARYTLIDGEVLTMVPGAQTLSVAGDGPVFAAYGRTADVTAWLADAEYNHVTLAEDGTVRTEVAEPEAAPASTGDPGTEDAAAEADPAAGETTDRSPVGSDLWLDEYQQDDRLSTPLQLPETMSVIVAADGTGPAPSSVTLTWPVDSSTPWAGPLIIGGGVVLLVGVFLYILGIRHVRRSRGPRRRGLPLPATEPIDLAVEGEDKGVVSAGRPRRRRALPGSGRRLVAVPVIALSMLAFAGCSADAWPQLEASETPSPTPSVIVPDGQQAPAVTDTQAERILTRVSSAVADADAALDPAAAATRLTGAALAERETNYTVRGQIADAAALPSIPDEPVEIILPQASDGWPRSFLSVVEGTDATAAPTIMVLTQDDPWADYKVSYVANLEASTNLPELAASYVGAVLAPPDSPFLVIAPEDLAAAYADVIDNAENSAHWSRFDTADDQLFAGIRADRQKRIDELNQTGTGTSNLVFASTAGSQTPFALTTLDGGAIVAVDVYETDTATATNEDAVIKLDDSPVVRALTGIDQSAKGFTTTYADQVFFYVPPQGSSERIRLLGYRSNILEAKEIS